MCIRLALVALLVGAAVGCGAGSTGPTVVASFYPLEFLAQRIVGDHAEVENLTAPGVEPHDLELSPRQVAAVSRATVVLHEQGMQPAVDEALRNNGPAHVVDAASVVDLQRRDGQVDPHFWLDPTLMEQVATALTDELVEAEPAHAADFRSANASLRRDLRTLDGEFLSGLARCRTRTVVVSHDAFGYLGTRYGLHIHAIAGLSPDAEPSPRRLGKLAEVARREGVTTIFTERLSSPRLAKALADDLGLRTAVLDPVEGLPRGDSGEDYLSVMRKNLTALRTAGGCR